ncbi:DUF669 domain-containing protein [Pasteurellaceae bacterium 20609_3]|uniref:DUF669 domain-containing protein n=1 Tax=Spirabiliibacterium mucosae TaxID=28156 RepID=UPI001AACE963|nr:DUF669 domain-containing protein [Spirabiliibacterium mucosae]MBE2897809.1 DUF669 domain-containing protein [Spirabiliibacterium mucosae]
MKPFNRNNLQTVLVPEGEYNATIEFAQERVSRNGNNYVSVGLRLSPSNRIVWRNLHVDGDVNSYATQRSHEEMARLMTATGYNEDVLHTPEDLLTGAEFPIAITHYRTRDGRVQEEVHYV